MDPLVRKRLYTFRQIGRRMCVVPLIGACLAAVVAVTGCDSGSNPLAPYEGHRPLMLQRVTQSFTPEIQWVGGRVAAVGVNRGDRAVLDSTLVWIKTSSANDINSHATVGQDGDEQIVLQYDGVPVSALEDGETYTFWVATTEAWEAGLDPSALDPFAFTDTTVTLTTLLRGQKRGGVDVELRIIKDERLTGTRYIVEWEPADHAFRRIAIRSGAASAGFTDLVWHVVLPEDVESNITSPLVIGDTPEGALEVTAWPETGFAPVVHTLWMVDDTWGGSFGLAASGMASFVILATNF